MYTGGTSVIRNSLDCSTRVSIETINKQTNNTRKHVHTQLDQIPHTHVDQTITKNLEVDQHFELLAVTFDVVFALSVVSLVLAL